MESYPKVHLNLDWEWKPSDLDDNGQWDNSEEDASFGANVSTTSYTRSDDFLESILPATEHKYPRTAF